MKIFISESGTMGTRKLTPAQRKQLARKNSGKKPSGDKSMAIKKVKGQLTRVRASIKTAIKQEEKEGPSDSILDRQAKLHYKEIELSTKLRKLQLK